MPLSRAFVWMLTPRLLLRARSGTIAFSVVVATGTSNRMRRLPFRCLKTVRGPRTTLMHMLLVGLPFGFILFRFDSNSWALALILGGMLIPTARWAWMWLLFVYLG